MLARRRLVLATALACLPAVPLLAQQADPQINTRVDYLLVGLGTKEDTPTNRSVVFHQILAKHGIVHDYAVGGNGAHDWATWRWLLHDRLLPNLFRPRK